MPTPSDIIIKDPDVLGALLFSAAPVCLFRLCWTISKVDKPSTIFSMIFRL